MAIMPQGMKVPRKEGKKVKVTQQNVIDGDVEADVLFASAAKMYKQLKAQNAEMRKEYIVLKAENAGFKTEREALKVENADLKQDKAGLELYVKSLRKKNKRLLLEVEELKTGSKLAAENAVLRDKLFRYELSGPPPELFDLS